MSAGIRRDLLFSGILQLIFALDIPYYRLEEKLNAPVVQDNVYTLLTFNL